MSPVETGRSLPTVDIMRETFTPDAVARLVSAFYERVRADEALAPIFEARITEWPRHLERMESFWGSVLRAEPGYRADERGSPREIHQAIDGMTHAHFHRWLELFEETAGEIFEPWAATNVVGRARRMAVVLSGHLDTSSGGPERATISR